MILYHQERGIQIYHGDSLAEQLPGMCDALIVDAPYGERTHEGHDAAAGVSDHGHRGIGFDGASRQPIKYSFWTPRNVRFAVRAWHPFTRGWMVSITDHVLAPHWARAMERAGRYVFAPLPWFCPGRGVRLAGDGPSSWTCWIIVGRPRCAPYSTWGTLPGGYMTKPERMPIVGGKPRDLMRALVRDYSREGDVVCDPCCGGGSTMRAAVDLGRTAIGIDISEEHCQLAAGRKPLEESGAQRVLCL